MNPEKFKSVNSLSPIESIKSSAWSGSNQGYFYPLIDYGTDFSVSSMNTINSGLGVITGQLFPATQVKTIIDKIFSTTGFTYQSQFLNSDYFKNLYIPFTGLKDLGNETNFSYNREFLAHISTGFTIHSAITYSMFGGIVQNTTVSSGEFIFPFDNTSAPNYDHGGLFNTSTYKYSADTHTSQQIFINIQFSADTKNGLEMLGSSLAGDYSPYSNIIVRFYRDGGSGGTIVYDTQYSSLPDVYNTGYTGNNFVIGANLVNTAPGIYNSTTVPGEKFWATYQILLTVQNRISGTTTPFTFSIMPQNTFEYNVVSTSVVPGQIIDYNVFIPKKIKQIDFFNSIVTMHNLYIEVDKNNPKSLIIEPRDDYYSSGTTLDWSNKWDASVPISQKLISEQTNKRIIFSYSPDSDFYNDNYSTATKKVFGDYYQIMDNDFVKDDKKIDIIFAPTPSVAVLESSAWVPPGSNLPVANEFVIPKIGKISGNNQFGATNFKLRILQKNAGNLIPLNQNDYWKFEGVVQKSFPFLGHLEHPSTGKTDINFGQVDYVYYTLPQITNNNLVSKYWQKYLNQIIDKDAKLITANFYLTPEDIQSFSFRNTIFCDGLTNDGGHYFFVNSIEYTPTSNATSKVELIKLNEKFVETTGTINIANVFGQIPFQSINLAGGQSYSTGSIAVGSNVVISSNAAGSVAIGNEINIGAPRSLVIGSGNTVSAGATNTIIIGNNITATTGNTLYVPNIFVSTGGTINNYPISAITIGSTLFTSGSGLNSIIADNGTGNIASADNSLAIGESNQAAGINSVVIGSGSTANGQSTIVLGDGLTGNTDNTVYVNSLNINNIGGGTPIINLGLDSTGNVVTGTTGGSGVSVGASYRLSSGIMSVPAAKNTIIPFDILLYDTNSNYNTTTNQFTCTVAGTYLINMAFSFSVSVSYSRFFRVNGVGFNNIYGLQTVILNVGDVVDFFVITIAGGGPYTNSSNSLENYFTLALL